MPDQSTTDTDPMRNEKYEQKLISRQSIADRRKAVLTLVASSIQLIEK